MENYFDKPGISQSYLKSLMTGPSKGSGVGSLTDALVTGEIHDYVPIDKMPSDALAPLFKYALDNFKEITDKTLIQANKFINYGKGKYTDKQIGSYADTYYDYIQALLKKQTPISREQFNVCESHAELFESHPSTQFLKDYDKQVEIFKESPYGTLKGKLDFFKEGSVVDFKTVASITLARRHFYDFRYDFQLAFYNMLTDTPLEETDTKVVFMAPDCPYPVVLTVKYTTLLTGRDGAYTQTSLRIGNETYTNERKIWGYQEILNNLTLLESMTFEERKTFFSEQSI